MIVDNNYNKFNINKMSRSGSNSSSTSGTTVYLKSGNKVDNIKASLDVHYLWGNEFDGTQDVNGDIIAPDSSAIFKNLTITGTAKFFQLMVDKIKSVGGAIILSPADGFDIIQIGSGTYTLNGTTYTGVKLYFNADDNDVNIANTWQAGDMLIIQDFNTIDSEHNSTNRYFWGIVRAVDTLTESIYVNGSYMNAHYVILDANTYDGTMPDSSYVGASCVQLGNISDTTRDGAIVISAYNTIDTDLVAPFFAIYDGINGSHYDLKYFRQSYFSMGTNNGDPNNRVIGELYVKDSNSNNGVMIVPENIGILDSWVWNNFTQTIIGLDGMFSGDEDKYLWKGSDGIAMKYSSSSTLDYRIKVNGDGITRSQVKDGQINIVSGVRIPMTDISTTMPVVTISAQQMPNGDPISIDKNAGFVVCTYTGNGIKVKLPHTYDCVGKIIYIKPYSNCTVYTENNEYILRSDRSPADQITPYTINNHMTAFISDGSSYWYEMSGMS